MKKHLIIIILTLASFSCSDYLDIVPDNAPVIANAFEDRTTTLRGLATCYSYMPNFDNILSHPAQIGSDEFFRDPLAFYSNDQRGLLLRQGLQTADNPLYDQWNDMYDAIRVCNIFLEEAPNVSADLSPDERDRWIAEAKVLKVFYHFQLMKLYGAVPIVRENLPVDTDIENTRVNRDPYDDAVAYLVTLLDEAMLNLPVGITNIGIDAGHVNQVVAATLKAEILVTAASPLYNGNPDINFLTNNDGVPLYSQSFDENKWTVAAEAAKEALDLALGAGHSFYNITDYPNISEQTRTILNRKQCVMERWNPEIIFSNSEYNRGNVTRVTPIFDQGQQSRSGIYNSFIGPTFATTEFFYSNNGVPIDEDITYPYENRFDVVSAPASEEFYVRPNYQTMQIHLQREPRYYSNLGFDGAIWFGNGRFKDINEGAPANETSYTFRMKEGEQQGKNGIRFSPTGLYCRKLVHVQSTYLVSGNFTSPGTFSFYRLAELYLLYAEALNESLNAPNQEVYNAIDAVREQAGLNGVVESWTNFSKFPDKVTTKTGMRDIIRHERTAELAFEGKRYYDIRRWLTATEHMNRPIEGFNVNEEETNAFNQVIIIEPQQFFTRDYFMPISTFNLRVNKNLVQNPFW